jgi:glycogen synthase
MTLSHWVRAIVGDVRRGRRDGRPRLLLLVGSLPEDMVGGMQVQAERMARELGATYDVVVLCRALRLRPGTEQREGYRVVRRPVLDLAGIRAACDVLLCVWQAVWLGRQATCIVAYQTLISGFVAVVAARILGVACLVSIRVDAEFTSELRHPIVRALSRFTWTLADRVLVQSPAVAEQFTCVLDRMRWPARVKTHVGIVPNGIDPLPPATTGGQDLVYVGRLHHSKGLDVLLDALAQVPASERPRLVLVGDGPLRPDIERRRDGLPVQLVGEMTREAALERMRTALAVVYPATRDGMSNAVMEAMAMGVPVIATRVAGLPDLVSDRVSGLLVPPGDASALRWAIQQLIEQPALRAQLGAAGRRAIACHSWTRSRSDLEREIELARAARRRGKGLAPMHPQAIDSRSPLQSRSR